MSEKFVLVFEDDPILGEVVTIAVTQIGVRVVLDRDGSQYPQLLKTNGVPALILLDLHMPFASGAELLKVFQADEHLAVVPVIVLTADVYQAHKLEAQGTRVLIKPVGLARLQQIVQQIL
jgi:two-component system, OmpR family, aerobic respiration control sensor histidine kinase ArcB